LLVPLPCSVLSLRRVLQLWRASPGCSHQETVKKLLQAGSARQNSCPLVLFSLQYLSYLALAQLKNLKNEKKKKKKKMHIDIVTGQEGECRRR
ncbi:hypothetical protein, partial [Clostridium perfringens]